MITLPPKPAPIMPDALQWAMVALVEGLELLGYWALAGTRQPAERRQPAQVTALDAARALARRRWGEPRQA